MNEDLNKIFEKIENENTINNMFFGKDINKITLVNIYEEAKTISPSNEKIYNWNNYYYIKLSKSIDEILLNLEIINNQRKVLASIALFGSPIRLHLSKGGYIDIASQKQFKKYLIIFQNITYIAQMKKKILILIYIIFLCIRNAIKKY